MVLESRNFFSKPNYGLGGVQSVPRTTDQPKLWHQNCNLMMRPNVLEVGLNLKLNISLVIISGLEQFLWNIYELGLRVNITSNSTSWL